MSPTAELGIAIEDPARIVYVRDGTGPSVLDAWEATTSLQRRLPEARELVLLDPISFPYEQWGAALHDVPLTVVLPDLPLDDLVALLGRSLLVHLTPLDRVVASGEVLAALHERGVLGPVDELALSSGDDPLATVHQAWRRERTVTCDTAFGPMTAFRDDLITRHLQEFGAHQRSDLAMLLSTVRPGDTVLDVGAHVGAFAVPLARACGPDGRLEAFEASPPTYELLMENLRRQGLTWATAHHAVVSDRAGLAMRSTMTAVGNTGAAGASRAWDGPGRDLRSTTLDDWWRDAGEPAIDVVKLDVEGHELSALQGARALLEVHQPVLQLEIAEVLLAANGTSSAAVLSLLDGLGYRFHVNALERNRTDDQFELRRADPAAVAREPVVDLLCTVDDDRTGDVG